MSKVDNRNKVELKILLIKLKKKIIEHIKTNGTECNNEIENSRLKVNRIEHKTEHCKQS